ncbi:MAG: hypothetical protein HQK55_04255 [Deltaproteobacteria bacterium]|nr:hypothetical protein [Deltaproteobacteria bacterium]
MSTARIIGHVALGIIGGVIGYFVEGFWGGVVGGVAGLFGPMALWGAIDL